jgi:hypothetical protein
LRDRQVFSGLPSNSPAFALLTRIFSGATALIEKRQTGSGKIEPKLLAFLAYLSALGLLTMKGMVEAQGDPLIYSDERLIDGFTQLFSAMNGT